MKTPGKVRSVYAHRVTVDSVKLPTRASLYDRFLARALAADDSVYKIETGDKEVIEDKSIEDKSSVMYSFEAFKWASSGKKQ